MTATSSLIDPLIAVFEAERVNYATGLMLDAGDFLDEQTYHRGRLARLVQALVGHGTLAGLLVEKPGDDDPEWELRVRPGIAADRHGRLIEITTSQCMRLVRWYDQQQDGALFAAMHGADDDRQVVCDLFLAAHGCARGHTPAFADGTFDSIDATVPSRVEERGVLSLVLRQEAAADLGSPVNHWPGAAASREEACAAVLGSWPHDVLARAQDGLPTLDEHRKKQDPAAILLARLHLPVEPPGAGELRPRLRMGSPVQVDNSLRPFIYLAGKWQGEALDPVDLNQP